MTTYSVTKIIAFCYGHRLLNYDGKCKFLHGHNGRVEIVVAAERLDGRGMVVDFGDVKKIVGGFIDEKLDHRMILCKKDPILALLKERGEPLFEMEDNPTAENIAKEIYRYAIGQKLPVSSVKLWETDTSFAVYEEPNQ